MAAWEGFRVTDDEMRFWNKVAIGDGCWEWQGSLTDDGYGLNWDRAWPRRAHRASWTIAHGPIPAGLMVLHNCPGGDNRRCVRPSHLWLGTHEQNMADRNAKGRTATGARNGATLHPENLARGDRNGARARPEMLPRGEQHRDAKLTVELVLEVRRRVAAGESQRSVARAMGVGPSTVRDVVRRATWTHI
jgi:hypothetical protein